MSAGDCIIWQDAAVHLCNALLERVHRLTLRYTGTAVTLHGFFPTSLPAFPSSISYSVLLDGVPTANYASSFTADPNSEDNILAAFTNLTNDEHFVELMTHNSGGVPDGTILLRFDRAVIESQLPEQ